jgi:hypothetical protein
MPRRLLIAVAAAAAFRVVLLEAEMRRQLLLEEPLHQRPLQLMKEPGRTEEVLRAFH